MSDPELLGAVRTGGRSVLELWRLGDRFVLIVVDEAENEAGTYEAAVELALPELAELGRLLGLARLRAVVDSGHPVSGPSRPALQVIRGSRSAR